MASQSAAIARDLDRATYASAGCSLPIPPQGARIPITSAADFGAAIRDARKRLKLTQQAFADLAGVGRRFVSELEGGKATLEIGKVLICCAAAGIDISATPRRQA